MRSIITLALAALFSGCTPAKTTATENTAICAFTTAAYDEAEGMSESQVVADVVRRCGPGVIAILQQAKAEMARIRQERGE